MHNRVIRITQIMENSRKKLQRKETEKKEHVRKGRKGEIEGERKSAWRGREKEKIVRERES